MGIGTAFLISISFHLLIVIVGIKLGLNKRFGNAVKQIIHQFFSGDILTSKVFSTRYGSFISNFPPSMIEIRDKICNCPSIERLTVQCKTQKAKHQAFRSIGTVIIKLSVDFEGKTNDSIPVMISIHGSQIRIEYSWKNGDWFLKQIDWCQDSIIH